MSRLSMAFFCPVQRKVLLPGRQRAVYRLSPVARLRWLANPLLSISACKLEADASSALHFSIWSNSD